MPRSKKRRSAKKPTGKAGPFQVRVKGGAIESGQLRIAWPGSQKDVERKILQYFVREFEKSGAAFLKIEDGGTRELDFLLTLPGGKSYLELMEVVVPPAGAKPHQAGAQSHWPIPYADKVFADVQKKIQKYGLKHQIPIDLLLYITHEQYQPDGSALDVLRNYFQTRPHSFHYVFFLIPLSEDLTPLHVIFNADHVSEPISLEELAGRWWINLPSANWELQVSAGDLIGRNSHPQEEILQVTRFPRDTVSEDGLTVAVTSRVVGRYSAYARAFL